MVSIFITCRMQLSHEPTRWNDRIGVLTRKSSYSRVRIYWEALGNRTNTEKPDSAGDEEVLFAIGSASELMYAAQRIHE